MPSGRCIITTSVEVDAPRFRLVAELSIVATATFGLYAVLWAAQRSLFLAAFANIFLSAARSAREHDVAAMQAAIAWTAGPLLCVPFLWLVLRARGLQQAGLGRAALAIPAVVALGLFALPPTLSDDVLSYLSHGYLAAIPGGNPYVDPSSSVASTAYGKLLLDQSWTAAHPATPYGPVWTLLERTAYVLSGNDVSLGVLLMKVPALVSLFLISVLILRFLRRHRPEEALRGCLLFLANPLVLIELAGDGHNDGLLAALLLGAVLATIGRRAFLAILLLAVAALVKTSVLPFVVPIAMHLFAHRGSIHRLIPKVLGALLCAGSVGALLVAPFWRGAATLAGLEAGGMLFGWSVAGALRHVAEFSTQILGVPAASALHGAQALLAVLLVAGTLLVSRGAGTPNGLVRASVAVSLVVLLLLPIAWPWYAITPMALLPLVPDALAITAVALFAVMSRLGAPLADAAGAGLLEHLSLYSAQTFVVQTVPAVMGLALEWSRRTATGSRIMRRILWLKTAER